MEISFTSHMIEWRGPAPYYFIPVPLEQSTQIKTIASAITYGWGVVYTHATIGERSWKTTLMPKDGLYLLPIRKVLRLDLKLVENQEIEVELAFDLEPR
jgi:hypothetical protein